MALKVIGLGKLRRKINRIESRLDRPSDIYHKAVIVTDKWIQKNFESEGKLAHTGSGWKPLKPQTERQRRLGPKLKEHKILQDTGQLKGRWRHSWNNHRGLIESAVPYGIMHHEGRGHLPVRRILPTQEQIIPELTKLFRWWLKNIITK